MADFNAVQVDRFDRAAKKLLAIKNGGILSTLAAELTASVDFTPGTDSELLASLGYIPWSAGRYVAAGGAGTYSKLEVVNFSTAASPWLVVVTRLVGINSAASAAYISIQSGSAPLALTPGTMVVRDTRIWGAGGLVPVTVAGVNSGTNAGVPATYATVLATPLCGGSVLVEAPGVPVYLGPVSSLLWEFSLANSSGYWMVAGYMRPLDPGELVP